MTAEELFKGLDAQGVPAGLEISGIAIDSRRTGAGFLFFALPGAHTDGALYAKEAARRGAAAIASVKPLPDAGLPVILVRDMETAMAVCAARFYSNPSSKMSLIGVTGTNGKTTTAYLLESVFTLAGHKPGVIGTISYRAGGEVLSKAMNTTPPAVLLQGYLAQMSARGAKTAIMEVSSHSLAQRRVDGIEFDAAIFTNLRRDHLDYHKTEDEYFSAKRRLFEMLARSPKHPKIAVLNGDDARSAQLDAAMRDGVKRVLFGLGENCAWRAADIRESLDGVSFRLISPRGTHDAALQLWGRYNVYNALAAVSCACAMGVPLETALKGAAELPGVPGRMERVRLGQDFHVFVDFAHTDSALEAALSGLREFPHGRIISVFGCGGERDRSKRGPMGVAACANSDYAFVTADNPRREPLERIFSDIETGLRQKGYTNYTIVPDREQAVFAAVKMARGGDIILLAGKGHEETQMLNGGTVRFSDRETVMRAIREIHGV